MIESKQHIRSVLLVCLSFSFLLSYAGPTHPAKPSSSTVNRDLDHIPLAVPLPLPDRSFGICINCKRTIHGTNDVGKP